MAKLSGVTVTLTKDGKSYTAITDDNGNYNVAVPTATGNYNITYSKEGYSTVTDTLAITGHVSKDVTMSEDVSVLHTVSGRAVWFYGYDSSAEGYRYGVKVAAGDIASGTYVGSIDSNGDYTINLPEGTHTISITRGIVTATASVTVAADDLIVDLVFFNSNYETPDWGIYGFIKSSILDYIEGAEFSCATGSVGTTNLNGFYYVDYTNSASFNYTASMTGYTSVTAELSNSRFRRVDVVLTTGV